MKIIRSFFITIIFLLAFSMGAMAQENSPKPQWALNPNGPNIQLPSNLPEIGTTTESQKNPIKFGSGSSSWYWAGSTKEGQTEITDVTLDSKTKGEINIVVGSNGTTPTTSTVAFNITNTSSGGWTIQAGQTLNIYQAASGQNENNIGIGSCFFTLYNRTPITKDQDDNQANSAITVESGGTLNIYSGAFVPTALMNAGLTVEEGGNVYVSPIAQLQPTYNTTQANTGNSEPTVSANLSNVGLNITGGALNNDGFLAVIQNLTRKTGTDGKMEGTWDFAAIDGLNPVVTKGGTVQTSSAYPKTPTNLTNGVWIESFGHGTSLLNNPITASTDIITAFGEATLYTGFIDTINLTGANNSLTVKAGANLTIPNGYTINFGPTPSTAGATQATQTANGMLTVENTGTLTIQEKANVNMYTGSQLDNSGNIMVEE